MAGKNTLTAEIAENWKQVLAFFEKNFQKKPDLNAILFLIGIRELGELPEKKYSKEEKTHLMHIANCKLLSYSGYYAQTGFNSKGWPVWENVKPLPPMNIFEQENLLRQHIIEYFENEEILDFKKP
ncbi:MAG: hypothetical protein KG003_06080 [Bacteroidetes bacterium]|nr:hypothetical protein [Bacteroidota bacterium]